jgi:hypothetical protein
MLPKDKFIELKEELDNCKKPLFLFDDDPDGLCSFLLFYRYKKEGNWAYVKSLPKVTASFTKYINYYTDKIFILDMPEVDESFFENVKIPIVWVDHHPHKHPNHVKSFNPHDFNYDKKDTSTTALCYKTVNQDLWLASVGAIADWSMPDFIDGFKEKYPDLLDKNIINPSEALFDSKISKIIQIFSMILKGNTKTTKQCILKLINIANPYEIIENQTSDAIFINNKVKPIIDEYNSLFERAIQIKPENGIYIFIYNDYNSFSSELANHIQYKLPNDLIIVGRLKNGEYKLSLRSQNHDINSILEKIMSGLDGYGGGHENACGVCINENHYGEFILRLKKELDL